jgi:hypothetical protein
MVDERTLFHIYQQWMQGNEAYEHRWKEFVELVARQYGGNADEIMSVLQNVKWFKRAGQ